MKKMSTWGIHLSEILFLAWIALVFVKYPAILSHWPTDTVGSVKYLLILVMGGGMIPLITLMTYIAWRAKELVDLHKKEVDLRTEIVQEMRKMLEEGRKKV